MIKDLIAKLIAKTISKKLDLKEGPMEDKKKWYQSKTILGAIVGVLFNAYEGIATTIAPQFGWNLPPMPPVVVTLINTLLGAVVVHGRVSAETKIG